MLDIMEVVKELGTKPIWRPTGWAAPVVWSTTSVPTQWGGTKPAGVQQRASNTKTKITSLSSNTGMWEKLSTDSQHSHRQFSSVFCLSHGSRNCLTAEILLSGNTILKAYYLQVHCAFPCTEHSVLQFQWQTAVLVASSTTRAAQWVLLQSLPRLESVTFPSKTWHYFPQIIMSCMSTLTEKTNTIGSLVWCSVIWFLINYNKRNLCQV